MNLRLVALVILFVLAAMACPAANADPAHERIAELIADIDSYVSWPETKANETIPFFVAVLGESPLADRILELNRQKLPSGRKIKVRRVRRELLPSNANILIVASPDEVADTRIFGKLEGSGTLTVSAGDKGLPTILRVTNVEAGGKNEVRTILDLKLAAKEGLDIKKKLKELAVTPETESESD